MKLGFFFHNGKQTFTGKSVGFNLIYYYQILVRSAPTHLTKITDRLRGPLSNLLGSGDTGPHLKQQNLLDKRWYYKDGAGHLIF